MAWKGASRISVVSADPDAFAGVDSHRVASYQSAAGKALMNLRKATQANKVSWTVVAAAGKQWAAKSSQNCQKKTSWGIMGSDFQTTRVYEEDPVLAWKKHDEN